MRTFTQKQKRSRNPASPSLARPRAARTGSVEADSSGMASPCFAHDFSRMPIHPLASVATQTKLTINQPGDTYEQEADRISDQVMQVPEPQPQRAGIATGIGAEALATQTHQRVQASPVALGGMGQAAAVPAVVGETLNAPGQPLDAGTRHFMESRFGHDFSRVRVHTGEGAAASAKAVGALAYACGSEVVFAAGQYAPLTRQGRQLLAHELAHVVQQQSSASQIDTSAGGNSAFGTSGMGVMQLQPAPDAKPTQPSLITSRSADTDRIEDAYGAGSLDENRWRSLVASARQEVKDGKANEATRDYLILYTDLAKLAQTGRVVGSPSAINLVTGSKTDCKGAKPGLNFVMADTSKWGARATTAYVDDKGKFGVKLNRRGQLQPDVAIVLTQDVFMLEKEQALGILRHEMIHAGHDADDASAMFRSDPMAPTGPKTTSAGNSELLGYVEGFMTMFHLTHPAPTALDHPVYIELLGALSTEDNHPWAEADPAVRSAALGQLQEYYCHALDRSHREAFDGWVTAKSAEVRDDQLATGAPPPEVFLPGGADEKALERLQGAGSSSKGSKGSTMGPMVRMGTMQVDFFHGLRGIIAGKCKSLAPPPVKR